MSIRTTVSSVCSVKRGEDCEISHLLADVYDADIMTGAIVFDTHTEFVSVSFSEGWGGGTPGKLSATYADLMTGLMVVTTYCGSLFVVLTGEGGRF